jgi:hypothetical protein
MITNRLGWAIVLAAFILAAAAVLRYAEAAGFISDELAIRTMQVLIGLMCAGYGNVMPKQLGRPRGSAAAESRAQKAHRVGGWSMTLAGLVYAGLWAFAPLGFADFASVVVVAAALLLTLGYAGWCMTACRRSGSPGEA